MHRQDGPAVEDADGTRWWYRHNLLHHDGGQANERQRKSAAEIQQRLRLKTGQQQRLRFKK
jgi:hypothetical protein